MEYFETLPIAYVSAGEEDPTFTQVLEEATATEGVKMFKVVYSEEAKARQMLDEGEIEAYIVGSINPELYVKASGLNETIIKSFLDTYRQMSTTVTAILKKNPNAINEGLLEDIMRHNTYLETLKNDKKPAELLVYFYSLLAFTCIFAGNWGLDEVVNIQANLSGRGARVSITPIPKMKLFLCNILAAFTAHMGSLILVFLYMYYVIKIDFGNNLMYLFAVCMVGSFAGLGLGAFIGVWVKKKAEIKEAIFSVVTLGGAFLSGMMMPDIKYMVATKFPALSYINPVNLLTDAMYSLYYYDTYDRFYINILLLGVIAVIFGILAIAGIRRKNYASI